MKKILNNPIALSMLISFLYLVGANIIAIVPYFMNISNPIISAVVSLLITVLPAIAMVFITKKIVGNTYDIGLNTKNLKKGILLASPCLIYKTIMLIYNIFVAKEYPSLALDVVVIALCSALSAGVSEELLNRGIYTNIMASKWAKTGTGIFLAAIISSLFFGCSHLVNVFIVGKMTSAIIWQILYATAIGCGFAAAYIRTKNLWGCIIIHTIYDFIPFLFTSGAGTNESLKIILSQPVTTVGIITNLIVIALGIGSMLILLRPSKHEEIRKLWATEA